MEGPRIVRADVLEGRPVALFNTCSSSCAPINTISPWRQMGAQHGCPQQGHKKVHPPEPAALGEMSDAKECRRPNLHMKGRPCPHQWDPLLISKFPLGFAQQFSRAPGAAASCSRTIEDNAGLRAFAQVTGCRSSHCPPLVKSPEALKSLAAARVGGHCSSRGLGGCIGREQGLPQCLRRLRDALEGWEEVDIDHHQLACGAQDKGGVENEWPSQGAFWDAIANDKQRIDQGTHVCCRGAWYSGRMVVAAAKCEAPACTRFHSHLRR